MKHLLNPGEEFGRYNGGWTKTILSLDKEQTNGYSLVGEFTKTGTQYYEEGKLYLDCSIGGSRKNNKKIYNLFTAGSNGEIEVIFTLGSNFDYLGNASDWAIKLWPAIEEFFNKAEKVDVVALIKRHKELVEELTKIEQTLDKLHNEAIEKDDSVPIPAPFNEINFLTII